MKYSVLTFLVFLVYWPLNGQVNGYITDVQGDTLSFASVYIKGTSIGTTSNIEGYYSLNLPAERNEVVFQYVGYKTQTILIEKSASLIQKNITLLPEDLELAEVVISANREDPAYPIMRRAIEKRKYFLDSKGSFSTDVYIKGILKFLDAPEKFLGQDVGDMMGTLDTNRQGIFYLSESEAKFYVAPPNKEKEVMISSKYSGKDQGFGFFNRASYMDLSLYKIREDLGRNVVSPLAPSSFSFYKFKLIGTQFDEDGKLINKIEVIPKNEESPTYFGYIYIVEDLWNIQSADLAITGKALNVPFYDTLWFKQVHVPVKEPDVWQLFSQNVSFSSKVFSFKVAGSFTAIFSNYNMDPVFPEGLFSNEIFRVEEGATEKDSVYWKESRPIKLTEEERVDYIKKDSLKILRESKPYLDSIDRKNNRLKPFDILTGFDYDRSYDKFNLSFPSPLFSFFNFNAVQGFNLNYKITVRKNYDDFFGKYLLIEPRLDYGLTEKKFRADLHVRYRDNRRTFDQYDFFIGRKTSQFNPNDPVDRFLNSVSTLFYKNNYLKIYEKEFVEFQYQRELFNGLWFRGVISYQNRHALINNTNFSFGKENLTYESNDPQNPTSVGNPSFQDHQAFTTGLWLRIRFNQKYSSFPNRKFIDGSKWPDIWLGYKKGISAIGGDTDFDLIRMQIQKWNINTGQLGLADLMIRGGVFLNSNRMFFADYTHFMGNEFTFRLDPYVGRYFQLPYYTDSTNDKYFSFHYEQHLNGFLLDRVPLLNKLGITTVISTNLLLTGDRDAYYELSVGLENLGIGPVRNFRLDFVNSWRGTSHDQFGVYLGVYL